MRGALTLLAGLSIISLSWTEAVMAQTEAPNWVRVTEHAEWAPRDSCGEVVHNDRMWLLGGWFNSNIIGPTDVWSSTDGLGWELVTDAAGWQAGDLPTTVVHDGRMWLMGGWYAGRLPEGRGSSEVWASPDGMQWECVNSTPGWSPRASPSATARSSTSPPKRSSRC